MEKNGQSRYARPPIRVGTAGNVYVVMNQLFLFKNQSDRMSISSVLNRADSVPCTLNFAVNVDEGILGQCSLVLEILEPLPECLPVMKDFLGRTVQIIAFLIRERPVQLVVRRKDDLNGATGFRLPEGNRIHKQGLVRQCRCQSLQLGKPPVRLDEFRAHVFIQIRLCLRGRGGSWVKGLFRSWGSIFDRFSFKCQKLQIIDICARLCQKQKTITRFCDGYIGSLVCLADRSQAKTYM